MSFFSDKISEISAMSCNVVTLVFVTKHDFLETIQSNLYFLNKKIFLFFIFKIIFFFNKQKKFLMKV